MLTHSRTPKHFHVIQTLDKKTCPVHALTHVLHKSFRHHRFRGFLTLPAWLTCTHNNMLCSHYELCYMSLLALHLCFPNKSKLLLGQTYIQTNLNMPSRCTIYHRGGSVWKPHLLSRLRLTVRHFSRTNAGYLPCHSVCTTCGWQHPCLYANSHGGWRCWRL